MLLRKASACCSDLGQWSRTPGACSPRTEVPGLQSEELPNKQRVGLQSVGTSAKAPPLSDLSLDCQASALRGHSGHSRTSGALLCRPNTEAQLKLSFQRHLQEMGCEYSAGWRAKTMPGCAREDSLRQFTWSLADMRWPSPILTRKTT